MFIGTTAPEDHQDIKKLFIQEPWLLTLFDEQWANHHLLFTEPRNIKDVHPLFWHLANPLSRDKVVKNLRDFSQWLPERKKFINNLKGDFDENNIASWLYQLETYCHLRRRGYTCEWEPIISTSTRRARPDLQVIFPNGQSVYLEVFSLFQSSKERKNWEFLADTQALVNRIPNNPYAITVSLLQHIQDEKAETMAQFIAEQIAGGQLPTQSNERTERIFKHEGHPLHRIIFELDPHGQGGFVASVGPGGPRNDTDRIRGRITEKLDFFQLPPRPALSGYIIFLNGTMLRLDNVVDAIMGNPRILFTQGSTETKLDRNNDGVIHDRALGARIRENIDFVLAIGNSYQGWTTNNIRLLYSQDSTLTKQEIEQIFIE